MKEVKETVLVHLHKLHTEQFLRSTLIMDVQLVKSDFSTLQPIYIKTDGYKVTITFDLVDMDLGIYLRKAQNIKSSLTPLFFNYIDL